MTEFLAQLSSPSWWLGIVVVSLLVNLASAYIKSPLDGFLSHLSKKWDERSALARQQRDALVDSLARDQHKQLLFLAAEMRCRLREILYSVLAVFLLVAVVVDPILSPPLSGGLGRSELRIIVLCLLLFVIASALNQRLAAIRFGSLVRDANRAASER